MRNWSKSVQIGNNVPGWEKVSDDIDKLKKSWDRRWQALYDGWFEIKAKARATSVLISSNPGSFVIVRTKKAISTGTIKDFLFKRMASLNNLLRRLRLTAFLIFPETSTA